MRKCKRLDLISTIVKDNDIRSKAEIVDYLDKHFGIKYSVATISRDLNELKIYKMPTANNDRCYRKFNGNAQNEAKAKLIAFTMMRSKRSQLKITTLLSKHRQDLRKV